MVNFVPNKTMIYQKLNLLVCERASFDRKERRLRVEPEHCQNQAIVHMLKRASQADLEFILHHIEKYKRISRSSSIHNNVFALFDAIGKEIPDENQPQFDGIFKVIRQQFGDHTFLEHKLLSVLENQNEDGSNFPAERNLETSECWNQLPHEEPHSLNASVAQGAQPLQKKNMVEHSEEESQILGLNTLRPPPLFGESYDLDRICNWPRYFQRNNFDHFCKTLKVNKNAEQYEEAKKELLTKLAVR